MKSCRPAWSRLFFPLAVSFMHAGRCNVSRPILLVPLDDRPVTAVLPARIAAVAGIELVTPPRATLGSLTRGADIPAVLDWMTTEAAQADALIVALDTLAYGGLVSSRRDPLGLSDVQARLATLIEVKKANPTLPIYAFSTLMRLSENASIEEEKDYWGTYGPLIYRYSFHQDRYEQLGDMADLATASAARQAIPESVLDDYLETRQARLQINRMLVDWTRRNLFDLLIIPQDDTARFGLNVREMRQLRADVEAADLGARVLMYPGTDEVASTLVARHLNRIRRRTPTVSIRYSTPFGGSLTPLYEDRPLEQTIAAHVQAIGGRVVPSGGMNVDVALFVNTPATAQGDLALRISLEKVTSPARDLQSFVDAIQKSYSPVALADVAYANGADLELFGLFKQHLNLMAFSAWNTAGNTVGTVLSHATAALDPAARESAPHRQMLLERLADDLIYQAYLRPTLQQEWASGKGIQALQETLSDRMQALWRRYLHRYPVSELRAHFPWDRLFEVEVALRAFDATGPEAGDSYGEAEPGDVV